MPAAWAVGQWVPHAQALTMLGKPSWSRNPHEYQQGIKEDRQAATPEWKEQTYVGTGQTCRPT